jgi:hypothetical protein
LASSSEAAVFLFSIERMRLSLSLHPQLSNIAPGLEPTELSFCAPHFFHQTRRGTHMTMILLWRSIHWRPKINIDLTAGPRNQGGAASRYMLLEAKDFRSFQSMVSNSEMAGALVRGNFLSRNLLSIRHAGQSRMVCEPFSLRDSLVIRA